MAKLSTIEDLEQRTQQIESQAAPVAESQAKPAPENASRPKVGPYVEGEDASPPKQRLEADLDMTAQQEEEFHGLDATQPMSLGHKSLIIVAAVVLVVAILYIVNSWIHFF